MASVSGTVAARLKLVDPEHAGPIIEDVVIRSHRIMTAATTVLAYEVLRCLEADQDIPAFWSNSVVEQAIGSVTANYKPRKRELAALHARFVFVRNTIMPEFELIDRSAISCVLKSEAVQYAANALTSLKLHVRKRVERLVKLRGRLTDEEYDALEPGERKAPTPSSAASSSPRAPVRCRPEALHPGGFARAYRSPLRRAPSRHPLALRAAAAHDHQGRRPRQAARAREAVQLKDRRRARQAGQAVCSHHRPRQVGRGA